MKDILDIKELGTKLEGVVKVLQTFLLVSCYFKYINFFFRNSKSSFQLNYILMEPK